MSWNKQGDFPPKGNHFASGTPPPRWRLAGGLLLYMHSDRGTLRVP